MNNNHNSNNKNKSNEPNKPDNNDKKVDKSIYYLSYFLTDNNKNNNRDRNKIKKYLIPLLTFIVENENFNKDSLTLKKSFSVIIKNNYEKLQSEFKEKYIELKNQNIVKEQKDLEGKIDKSFEDAKLFLRDFRNIMMHKNVKEDTFSRFDFEKFDGELFSFLRIYLEAQKENNLKEIKILEDKNLSLDKSNFKKNYIEEILKITPEEMKKNVKNVPFIYCLMILAMFTESKYIKELLDLIKVKKFVKDIVSSFSLRGGYKTLVPGIVIKDDELYKKQIDMSKEINKKANDTGKRIIKDLKYFNVDKEKTNINSEEIIYKNILKFYGYGNSFPKIEELEDAIREFKAKELSQANKNKIESDYNKIIPTLKNVFRNEDIFMKEAIRFLSYKHGGVFGKDTWTISGNAVIWLEPNDNLLFDLRKRIKPSKNGMNSIYKIVYNKENADRFSLNRYNLRALITSILIKGGLNFKELKKTSTNDLKVKNPNTKNTNYLAQDLKNKIPNWNSYKQASLVVKTVRKSIIGDIHLHNVDSISFHQNFMRILCRLDNKIDNIYSDAIDIITTYGIPTKNVGEEISKLLKYDNLKDMALASADILVKLKKKKDDKQSEASFKTWSKFAFLPVNNKNEKIYSLLGWENIKDNLINNNDSNIQVDIFEILYNYFKKNNIALPPIVDIYKNYIKINEIKYYRNKEIRNIIAEEMILYFISHYYIQEKMPSVKDSKKYFYFESYTDEKDNSPFKFNLIWDLNPRIKINIKDYMKRDVRQALDYIFDIYRIKNEGKINGKEDLQKCLESCLSSYNIIRNDEILKSKCPKQTSTRENNILNEDNIKDIVKALIWAQKELLYFICNIEVHIIYTLYNTLDKAKIDNLKEDGNYFNFFKLIEFYNQNIETIKLNENFKNKKKFDDELLVKLNMIRKMLAHGRLIDEYKDKHENINYSSIISILDMSLKNIFGKSLSDFYGNKNHKTGGEKKYYNKSNNKFVNEKRGINR